MTSTNTQPKAKKVIGDIKTTKVDQCPPELLARAIAAATNAKQSNDAKNGITMEIFTSVQEALRQDFTPQSFFINTCEAHGFAHDRPVTVKDDVTSAETHSFVRVKATQIDKKMPATFKTLLSAAIKVNAEGHNIDTFRDSYEGENGTFVSGVSKLRKKYKEILDADKDFVALAIKKLLKDFPKSEDQLRASELIRKHLAK
tara:strand:+ start:397 stop:999 length:603 start_codon:yes stop_codon:yes gene_type:complete